MKIEINLLDLDLMLMGYMRYALGRSTYITSACAETLEHLVPQLPKTSQIQYIQWIQDELNRCEEEGTTCGMKMDHETWRTTVELLKRRYKD